MAQKIDTAKAQVKTGLGESSASAVLDVQATTIPMSEGQKGLWTLHQWHPASTAYNIPLCFRIAQPLDVEALKHACRFLQAQHPILNSRIQEVDGEIALKIQSDQELEFSVTQLTVLDDGQVLEALRQLTKTPFELSTGPLVRFHFCKRREQESILLIVLHHIVFDGGSFLPVMTTLLDAYQQLVEGNKPAVLQPDISAYRQFVEWEQGFLASKAGEKQLAYWQRQLDGASSLNLPTDYPRSQAVAFQGQVCTAAISPELGRQIREFAQRQRMNLSVLFLGCFKLLLHRYSGQRDIVVGMPEKGRPLDQFNEVVGYFINMLPIRSQNMGNQSFADFIKDLQLTMVDALDNSAYPFSSLVRQLGIASSAELSPVFQVAFEFQNAFSANDLQVFHKRYQQALPITFVENVHQEGEYEIVLEVHEQADGFVLNLKFNPSLYQPDTISRMLAHYDNLLGQAIAQPDCLPWQYRINTQEEERQLLFDWNETQAAYPKDCCFHELFERQGQNCPDAIAVVFESQSLSYAQLIDRSTVLAKCLQSRGVKPDQLVAICVERSLDMLVGLLAILKAGAAYVPLDPLYPAERLAYILDDSQAALLLTQSSLLAKVNQWLPTL